MSSKHTPKGTSQRSAAAGPWVKSADFDAFCGHLTARGIQHREHADPFIRGIQVHHDGHWMAVQWNKNWKRYTADRRLSLIVQSFAAERAATAKATREAA